MQHAPSSFLWMWFQDVFIRLLRDNSCISISMAIREGRKMCSMKWKVPALTFIRHVEQVHNITRSKFPQNCHSHDLVSVLIICPGGRAQTVGAKCNKRECVCACERERERENEAAFLSACILQHRFSLFSICTHSRAQLTALTFSQHTHAHTHTHHAAKRK